MHTNIVGIQIGDNTHIHDQFITPTSFNTMNTKVKRPQNPIPVLAEPLLFIFFLLYIVFTKK